MLTPIEHIEEIRKTKFSIGGQENPLTEDLHQAVKNLSAELYAKDVHFLMELIQNAEDNEYSEGVKPSLEFIITSQDITGSGASDTLLVFNNEKGFSTKNIESICSVGRSTKKGNRKRGYIGEKGIGFKSVFLISSQPYIFSNGYQIRFNEEPCPHCGLGYIVPEWVDESPTLSDLKQVYGSNSLPTTTLILPLKPDKVKPVKQQLSSIHPEVLLFLSKIKSLSVRENNEDPKLNTVKAISILSETNFVMRKNIDAESYIVHLSADDDKDASDRECSYHMWRQRFPVRDENRVERRMEVDEWVITLAFPIGRRLNRGMSSPSIYAFLPTEMFANFPFIIQADFVLASSRETILLDNNWNRGILDCVPSAFLNAFVSLVKMQEDAPISTLASMFCFLPIQTSSFEKLNSVRKSIQEKLMEENIIPCESYMEQKFFCKPREVGRLLPDFWSILIKARKQGVSLHNLSSHDTYIISSSFDRQDYDEILSFLGVKAVNYEWYPKCIRSSNLVMGASDDVYLELLLFITENWSSIFQYTNINDIPLVKCIGPDGNLCLFTITELTQWNGVRLCVSGFLNHASWMIAWSKQFIVAAHLYFLPKSTLKSLCSFSKKDKLMYWLTNQVKASVFNVYEYADLLNKSVNDRKLVIAYIHFLYHSLSRNYLSKEQVDGLCAFMPLVDNYGRVAITKSGVLVPARGSNWVGLIGSNPWRQEGFLELGEDYLLSGFFAGVKTPEKGLLKFLETHVGASDIPYVSPPNAAIPTISAPLTKKNAVLLLQWIHNLKCKGIRIPEKFLTSIKEGSWLRVSISGCSCWRPPSQSFLLTSSLGTLLQSGSVLVDIPLIDENFYGETMNEFKEELKTMGVMFEYKEACEFIGKRLMSLADSSNLTRNNVFSILNFIKFLRENYLPLDSFIQSISGGRWLRTLRGDRSPDGSVLFDDEWKAASQVSDIPFIDQEFYGGEILCFKTELKLLGVIIGFNKNYQLVVNCFNSSANLSSLTEEAFTLILRCIRSLGNSSGELIRCLKEKKCIKTNRGYKFPRETFLYSPEWSCLLHVFNSLSQIDENFSGTSLLLYKNELKQLGIVVAFEEAAKVFAREFEQHVLSLSIRKENLLLFLECCRKLKGTPYKFPSGLKQTIREKKWLRSCFGDYRSPKECILFGPDWELISPITLLPFIDESESCYGKNIYDYKNELKGVGVVTEFHEGAKFVASGIRFPSNPSTVTSESVLCLLECTRNMQQQGQKDSLPDAFLKRVLSHEWLKTYAGYRTPDNCCLFDSKWGSFLNQKDGPFIDEGFYGSGISSYREELHALGVTLNVENGCRLIAGYLSSHSNFATIVRIYRYLSEFKWEPDCDSAKVIWIPNGKEDGEWVSPKECVIHDKDGLFGAKLNVLEKYYDLRLLSFFSSALDVKSHPSIGDYCQLWKEWENSGRKITLANCCAFWAYIAEHWSSKAEKTLAESLVKVPVDAGSDEISLLRKCDVFIADDLQLKDLFEKSSSPSIFVWYPQPNLSYLPRRKLLEIYRKIGVRNISESVQKQEISLLVGMQLKPVNPKEVLIGRGLFKLILGFLAAKPSLKVEAERRHESMEKLLRLSIYEAAAPVEISYSLPLSSGDTVIVKACRMVRWEKESSKLFTQKLERTGGHKKLIEYATYFAEVISKGVLWEDEDHMFELCELIKLGCLLDFNEEAIGFLMKTKNLQIFKEDEEFLASAFPSD